MKPYQGLNTLLAILAASPANAAPQTWTGNSYRNEVTNHNGTTASGTPCGVSAVFTRMYTIRSLVIQTGTLLPRVMGEKGDLLSRKTSGARIMTASVVDGNGVLVPGSPAVTYQKLTMAGTHTACISILQK